MNWPKGPAWDLTQELQCAIIHHSDQMSQRSLGRLSGGFSSSTMAASQPVSDEVTNRAVS